MPLRYHKITEKMYSIRVQLENHFLSERNIKSKLGYISSKVRIDFLEGK